MAFTFGLAGVGGTEKEYVGLLHRGFPCGEPMGGLAVVVRGDPGAHRFLWSEASSPGDGRAHRHPA